MTEARTPRQLLVNLQIIEYLRAFLVGRTGWSRIGAILIVSGAFGIFRREDVIEAGGYDPDSFAEDAELVLRLHRLCRERGRPYRIGFIADPVCWTEAPSSLAALRTQRERWQRGLLQVLWRLPRHDGPPRYGSVGMFALPYFVVFEAHRPARRGDRLRRDHDLARSSAGCRRRSRSPSSASPCALGIAFSFGALLVEERAFQRYRRWSCFGRLVLAAGAREPRLPAVVRAHSRARHLGAPAPRDRSTGARWRARASIPRAPPRSLEVDHERHALEPVALAQPVLEEVRVVARHEAAVVHLDREARRLRLELGSCSRCAAACRARPAAARIACRSPTKRFSSGVGIHCAERSASESASATSRFMPAARRGRHRHHLRALAQLARDARLRVLEVRLRDVPLVQRDHRGALLLHRQLGHAQVLGRHALARVADDDRHVGALGRLLGAELRVVVRRCRRPSCAGAARRCPRGSPRGPRTRCACRSSRAWCPPRRSRSRAPRRAAGSRARTSRRSAARSARAA